MRHLLVILFCFLPLVASGQGFPGGRTVRVVVPGPPGSSLDALGRELATKLSDTWKSPVIVEHRPGQGSGIGADHVAKSAPDGLTWLIAPYNVLTLNPHLYGNPAHPLKQFTPVTKLASVPFLMVVHPSTGFSSVADLVDYARRNPGKLNYGTSGAGSAQHLAAELFKSAAKVDLTGVAYKGGANAITDLLAGRVQVYFGANNSLVPHVKAGKLKALATAGARRSRGLPDLATIAESGLPGYDVSTWNALVLAAGVPADVVQVIHAAATGVLAVPEIRERLAAQGIEVEPSTPQELGALVSREYELHGRLVKEAGIKVE